MARIRTIKPELWQDERIGTLPYEARLLFVGLISHADDEGRLRGNPRLIRAQVFPYDDIDVEASLRLLEERGRIIRYDHGGERYIAVVRFVDHQRIEKPKPSAFPPPPTRPRLIHDSSTTPPGSVPDESRLEGKGREGSGTEGSGGDTTPPPPKVPLPRKPADDLADPHSFFAAVQHQRAAAGLPVEKPPPLPAMGRWWSEALGELQGDAKPLVIAYRDFAKDPYWRRAKPPAPFGAFVSEWRKYVPVRQPVR